MLIIGCEYHPGIQQIAWVETETGELSERRWAHLEQAEQFYREIKQRNVAVRVGMESSGHSRRLGHISKQANVLLRFLLVEAAQVTVRSQPEWRNKFFYLAMPAAIAARHRSSVRTREELGNPDGEQSITDVMIGHPAPSK